jgi:[protein-PII] uridylyltransferase
MVALIIMKLISLKEVNYQVEELIAQNKSDFEISKVYKNAYKSYVANIKKRFLDNPREFSLNHSKFIDEFLISLFKYILRKNFGNYTPMKNNIPINLVSLGSYGRREMSLYSDIDLMILYSEQTGYNSIKIIEEFLTLIWDCGLNLGHRVHELSEIVEVSQTDITIKTALLESRLIYGSSYLYVEYQNHLKIVKYRDKEEYISQKIDEYEKRLEKYPLRMQTDLKKGYGGLREANTLFWIASVRYHINSLKDLVDVLYSPSEYARFRQSFDFITSVRNALHITSNKKSDLLVSQYLIEVCDLLHIEDKVMFKKERILLSRVFEALHNIHRFCSIYIDKFIQINQENPKYSFAKKRISNLHNISNSIFNIENRLYISSSHIKKSNKKRNRNLKNIINELSKIELHSCDTFAPSYIQYISITSDVEVSETHKRATLKLLNRPNSYTIFRAIYDAGVLHKLIPPFKSITNQPQFDGYHIHPVDIHSLRTLYHIENIKNNKIKDIYQNLNQDERFILKLAGLFHDIGKGKSGDHHSDGEAIFKRLSKEYEIDEEVSKRVQILIRHHDQMNFYAKREDIYSQKIVLAFISKLQTIENIKLLYILTYADVSSVDMKLFTASTAYLLDELYRQSLIFIDDRVLLEENLRRTKKERTIKNHKDFKSFSPLLKKKIFKIESNYLFFKFSSIEIMHLTKLASNVDTFSFKVENDAHLKIKIIRKDEINLGYLLGKLTNLDILSTNIFALYDGKKYFEIVFSQSVEEDDVIYIKEIIKDSFDMSKSIKLKKPIIEPKDIQINLEHSQNLASINIHAKNQKGLFAYVAKLFDKYNIDIESAKITTLTRLNKINDLIIVNKDENFLNHYEEVVESLISI